MAGFFRHPNPPPGRNIEAYSWGGLTSRNVLRSLWLLLLPFTLVNLAGWMVEADPHPEKRRHRQWHAEIQERAIRLVAFLVTISFVTWAAAILVDLVAHQCGGQPICHEGHWWLDFLGRTHFEKHPAARMTLGVVGPLFLLFVLTVLAYKSRRDFERFNPHKFTDEAGDAANLRNEQFWYRPSLVSELSWIHIAGAILTLLAQTAYSLSLFELGEASNRLRVVAWASVAILLLLAVATVLLRINRQTTERVPRWRRKALMWVAIVAAAGMGLLGYYAIWRVRAIGNFPEELVAFRRLPFLLLALEGIVIFVVGLSQFVWWWMKKRRQEQRGGEARRWPIFLAVVFMALVLAAAVKALWVFFVWIFAVLAIAAFVANWRRKPSLLLVIMAGTGLVVGGAAATQGNWTPARVATAALAIAWTLMAVDASWQRDRFRWGGTATVSLLAVFILTGSFAGVAKRIADFLDRDPTAQQAIGAPAVAHINLELPAAYDWFSVVFATSLVLLIFAAAMLYLRTRIDRVGWVMPTSSTRPIEPPAIPLEGDHLTAAESQVASSVAMARTAKAGDLIFTFLAGMTGLALLTGVVRAIFDGSDAHLFDRLLTAYSVDQLGWLLTPSSWLLASLPALFVVAFRKGFSSEATRRKLGIVWDVASFWPRRFHPLAAPSYAERVVPELQQRIKEAVGDGSTPRSKVVIAAHSQGSVVAFAALATRPVSQMQAIALATYGSPLGSLYHRAFPTYFTLEDFDDIARALTPGTDQNLSRWKNFYRDTDPIGGIAFTEPWPEPEQLDPRDVYLADPYLWCFWEGQPVPRPLGHSDYIYDDKLSDWLRDVFRP